MDDLDALAVITLSAASGVRLTPHPNGVRCAPPSKLTPALRALIASCKQDLLVWLRLDSPTLLVSDPLSENQISMQSSEVLARAYYLHHFGCCKCQSAGRGHHYGVRCGVGMSLWTSYSSSHQALNALLSNLH